MAIIKDGIEVDYNILDEKWGIPEVYGGVKAEKPGYCVFKNTSKALEMLNKHIVKNSKMVLHTDVDMDGIGTTYILKRALEKLGSHNHMLVINKDKIHGVQRKHAEYFNNYKVDLIIVTDSSSNELETIKMFNCDVLCVDHHEISHRKLSGKCNDGVHDYVIVNNTIDNDTYAEDKAWLALKSIDTDKDDGFCGEFKGDSAMSCGLVIYELLRVYCKVYYQESMLENMLLYQWAGVTLFTDVVDTLNKRNQWYLDKTVFNMDVERTLGIILSQINKFKAALDKSYIQYTFAPIINKAIRAGSSSDILGKVINSPANISDNLELYNQLQAEAIEKATMVEVDDTLTGAKKKVPVAFSSENVLLDISNLGIHPNYMGVIANRIQGNNNKNAAIYITKDNGLIQGSFRGKHKTVDYRKFFDDYSPDTYAQGHSGAFGFKLKLEQAQAIMQNIPSIEPKVEEKPWLTAGNMSADERGKYHITDIEHFKRQGYVWMLATGNAKVCSTDEIVIRVKASDVTLKETKGKLYIYSVLGMDCKAFKPLEGKYFDIYIEYSNEICFYIK